MENEKKPVVSFLELFVRSAAILLIVLILLMDSSAFLFWVIIGVFDEGWSELALPVLFVCLIVSFLAFLFICALFGLGVRVTQAKATNEKVRVLSDFGHLIDLGWEPSLRSISNCSVIVLVFLVLFAIGFWKDLLWWSAFSKGMRSASAHHYVEAKEFFQRSVEAADKEREPVSFFLLANNSVEAKEYAEAERQFEEAIDTMVNLPHDHRALEVAAYQGLARSLIEQKKYAEAEQAVLKCVSIFKPDEKPLQPVRLRVIGPFSTPSSTSGPTLAGSYSLLEEIYAAQGQFDKCKAAFENNFAQYKEQARPSALEISRVLTIYSQLLDKAKSSRDDMIDEAYSNAQKLLLEKYGEGSTDVLGITCAYGDRLRAMGRFEAAEKVYGQALAKAGKALDKDHPLTLRIAISMASLYGDMKQFAKSEELFKKTLAAYEAKNDKSAEGQLQIDACREAYAKMLKQAGRPTDAAKLDSKSSQ